MANKATSNRRKGINTMRRWSAVVVFLFYSAISHSNNIENMPIVELKKLAVEHSNVEAIHEIGNRYYLGNGVSIDNDEAMKWYQRSADKGYLKSQHNLASLFVDKNNGKMALHWAQLAAKNGEYDSQYLVGVIYLNGINGVQKNIPKALDWLYILIDVDRLFSSNLITDSHSS